MTSALATSLAKVTTTAEVEDIRFLRPDIAIVSATKNVTDENGHDDTFAAKGAMTYVVVNDAGAGLRSLAHTTPVAGS